jgi:ComF family protein
MISVKEIKDSCFHIVFPHVCSGCGSDLLNRESMICIHCLSKMPATNFHLFPNNPVEKIFWGRIPLVSATAQYYFSKNSLMQYLMHQFKYKGNKELGRQLGYFMGNDLLQSKRFNNVDALVPLPLFASRQKRRGYNQAAVLCEGIAGIMNLPVYTDVIIRPAYTETQTKKGRVERWENIEGKFQVADPEKIQGKYLLLIDDVITTGATLEACAKELLDAASVKLSIAALCYTSR